MLRLLRPRRFGVAASRKFNANSNLLGKPMKGESSLVSLNRVSGMEKTLLNKLNFLYITGNVFTLYWGLKGFGWLMSVFDRKHNQIYENQILAQAAQNIGLEVNKQGMVFLI